MNRRCVSDCMIVSLTTFVLFVFSARVLFAEDRPEYGETPGYLEAFDRGGESLGSCPLVHTEVKAEISGILSSVTVRQKFHNPFESPIEAVYTFPLPHNAAIDDMTIHVGRRVIHGTVMRMEEAKVAYQRARDQGKLTALLDQERPNIFTQQVANILPGQNVDIVIRYMEKLEYSNGGYIFVYPMVVGPRYIPGLPIGRDGGGWAPDTTEVPDASRITPPVTPPGTRSGHDVSIEVNIESAVPFTNLQSQQHELAVISRDRRRALVRLADRAVIPNKDFILSFDVAGSQLQDGMLTHKHENNGYFMLVLQPPGAFKPDQIVPKELVFILDTSGSMSGFPIEKAKETMMMALDGLYPYDTFNLITFSGDTHILFPRPVPATGGNLELARQFLASRYGSGGTEMMRAIRAALEPSDSVEHVRIVCFMTDGFVGNDMAIISEVQNHPNARVFSFGIGSSPNRFLLDKIAEEGRGVAEYVTLEGDAAAAAKRFNERIRNPLLTDITLKWSGVLVSDIYPRRIPDLFSAEPVVLCGRYDRGGQATVRLRGRSGRDNFERQIRIFLPESEPRNEALGKLWARYRIGSLMAKDFAGIQNGNPRREVQEAITQLGLEYGLMTQFTSFVAVEERIANEDGNPVTVQVPVEMPEGTSYEGVFVIPAMIPAPAAGIGSGVGKGGGIGYGSAGIAAGGVAGGIPGGVAGGVVGGLLDELPKVSAPSPPPPPQTRPPKRIGGDVLRSQLIRQVKPEYPDLAKRAHIEDVVILVVTVDEEGNVSDVRVARGHPLLRDAAIAAVKQWKYSPTLLNGTPIPVTATTTVVFRLPDSSDHTLRVDPVVLRVLANLKSGESPEAEPFIRDGKAEVELTVDNLSNEVMEKLRQSGFESISRLKETNKIVGRIAVDKLESLLDIDAVLYIAPYYR